MNCSPLFMATLCVLLSLQVAMTAAARLSADATDAHQDKAEGEADDATAIGCWASTTLNMFTKVDVSCGFPPEGRVEEKIKRREREVVKITSTTDIHPGSDETVKVFALPEHPHNAVNASQLKNADISDFLKPLHDTCYNSSNHPPVEHGEDVYNNIKAYIDAFDIYTKCTKVYVPHKENGKPKMRKDDIIAIVTEPVPGSFTLSYEDVVQYMEYVDTEGTKTLIAIITSRKKNVIEGNYDVTLQLFTNGTVRLSYTKRQNLAEWVFKAGMSHNAYKLVTQDSVDRTMIKLATVGRYGSGALDDKTGCYVYKHCADYFTKHVGDVCKADHECTSGKCKKSSTFQSKKCADK